MESCVPPGFRFHPTDEELVGYYLRKKVALQKIDLDVIRDIDLYRIEPWDLQERCRIGYEEQNEWYFFSHKDKKYPTGTRTNRATMAGFWKATGRDKAVYDKAKLIGMRKTLVFYKGRAPNGQKSDWIMHEYRLESDENGPTQEEGWVVCRAFKKKTNGQTKSIEGWDSSYFYEETSGMSSMIDPINDYISAQPQSLLSQSFLCKKETEAENSLCFVQLPQLESPSLPLIKRPSSVSLLSENNVTNINEDQEDQNGSSGGYDPINDYISAQPQSLLSQSFLCKKETEAENSLCFVQLPQLESPSLPLIKRPSSVSLLSENNVTNINEDQEDQNGSSGGYSKKVTDWRALDKFVASQLSHDQESYEQGGENGVCSSFGMENNLEMPSLVLLQSGRDDENKFNGFLSSSSDCDIGICIFDK